MISYCHLHIGEDHISYWTIPDINDYGDWYEYNGTWVPCLPRYCVDFSDNLVWMYVENSRTLPLLF